mmetsp:Transcript_10773/g.25221  ORF Transcript_10773/g.25221 Transcript_10773/m.25221 type:complete len:521 (+) Transcript_10773:143-1705(+)
MRVAKRPECQMKHRSQKGSETPGPTGNCCRRPPMEDANAPVRDAPLYRGMSDLMSRVGITQPTKPSAITPDCPRGRPTPGAISNLSPVFMVRPAEAGRTAAAARLERRERGAEAGAKAAAEAAMARTTRARCIFLVDRELDVLHILVVHLELLDVGEQLGVRLRHLLLENGDDVGRPDPGHHVLALGIDEVLAIELVLASRRIAREEHTGPGRRAEVAEDHRLHRHGRPEKASDVVDVAVGHGAVRIPRVKHRVDRELELLLRILRELLALRLVHRLVSLAELHEVFGSEVRVLLHTLRLLQVLHRLLEERVVDAEHDVPEHVQKPPVRVVREPRVCLGGKTLDDGVGQPEVQNCVHHPGHRLRRAGAHRDEEGLVGVAKLHLHLPLDLLHPREHVVPHARGEFLASSVVVVADLRRDCEPGRHGEPDLGHLGEVRALPPEEVAHRRVAVGAGLPEVVHARLVAAAAEREVGGRGGGRGRAERRGGQLRAAERGVAEGGVRAPEGRRRGAEERRDRHDRG